MALTAHLFTTVYLTWEASLHGREYELEIEVDYDFDGNEVKITRQTAKGIPLGLSDWELDEMVWDAVNDQAPEAYAEWLEEYHAARADAAYERMCEREWEAAE